MRVELPELGGASETLWAVVLGALLATLGGFIAGRFEAWLRRRERERDAALLMGEITFTIGMLLKLAAEARGIGDPYGAITLRMLRGTRREVDIYDRNREQLFDLADPTVRVGLHSLIVTITLSLDSILESTQRLEAPKGLTADQQAEMRAARDRSFDFVIEHIAQIDPMLVRLATIARTSFDGHEAVARR